MTFDEWLTFNEIEDHPYNRKAAIAAWDFNGAQQAAAERERIDDEFGNIVEAYSLRGIEGGDVLIDEIRQVIQGGR